MNIATHTVEVPFPKRSLFLRTARFRVSRYGCAGLYRADRSLTARWECAHQRGPGSLSEKRAHAHVERLVLLPVATIYHGTQRNTIDLSRVQHWNALSVDLTIQLPGSELSSCQTLADSVEPATLKRKG